MNQGPLDSDFEASKQDKTFLDRLAERLGVNARAEAVYGSPVERDGATVIPVAKVRWGLGGGDGGSFGDGAAHGAGGGSGGRGGGGGVTVSPLGYIEIVKGQTRFRRINDPASFLPVVVAGGLAAALILRGLRKIVR
ncbi:MAG: spore germination protein GerW family protein [Thermoleophilia bacterium]